MLANLTSKNQLTLPKAVAMRFPGVKRFEVIATNDEIVLRPAKAADLDAVWAKLEALGLTEDDMADAVQWARKR
ncbi:MAG: AbrB/MazE/SpoVT family DNA-binding domain-containing protein [Polaromonas sp.]